MIRVFEMNNNILVSFIIPAHNAAKTIEKCVRSIICCDREDYEIIIVENGSSDDTYNIALSLSNDYSSVKVFQSEKGVSNARNCGIDNAAGKWLFFADADDAVISSNIDIIFDDASVRKSDLIIYGHIVGAEKRPAICSTKSFVNTETETARIKMLETPTRYMTVWAKLFNHNIIDKYNIRFNSALSFSEDSQFVFNYTKYCSEILFSEELIYSYALSEGSAVRTLNSKKTDAYILALNETAKLLTDESEAIKSAFNKYVLMHLNLIGVHEIFDRNNTASFTQKTKMFKDVCNNLIFADSISRLKIADCKSIAMLPPLFAKFHIYVFSGIICVARAVQNKRKAKN